MSKYNVIFITAFVVILGMLGGFLYINHIQTEQTRSFIESGYNYGYTEHNDSVYEYYILVIENHDNETMRGSIDYYVATGYINGYNQRTLDDMNKSHSKPVIS
jgi:uncharacterized membrane protein YukC